MCASLRSGTRRRCGAQVAAADEVRAVDDQPRYPVRARFILPISHLAPSSSSAIFVLETCQVTMLPMVYLMGICFSAFETL